MTDTGKQGGSTEQAPKDPQPQAGTGSPSQAEGAHTGEQAPSAASESGTSAASTDDGRVDASELQKARREAAGLRTENARLKRLEEDRQTATLSETERLQHRISQLEAENTELKKLDGERTVRLAVVEAATRLGFRNPEVAYRLIDADAVEQDDAGQPKNIERLLKSLLDKEPYLGKPNGAADFGAGQRGQTPDTTPGMSELIKRAAGY